MRCAKCNKKFYKYYYPPSATNKSEVPVCKDHYEEFERFYNQFDMFKRFNGGIVVGYIQCIKCKEYFEIGEIDEEKRTCFNCLKQKE